MEQQWDPSRCLLNPDVPNNRKVAQEGLLVPDIPKTRIRPQPWGPLYVPDMPSKKKDPI